MDLHLDQDVALIVGGAGGIGRAIALGFANEGAGVAVWDVADDLERVKADLLAVTDRVFVRRVDMTVTRDVRQALMETIAALGRIDHLVQAAAVGSGKFGFPFTNLTPDDWPRVIDVNVMGMVQIAHAVAPVLMAQRSGTMHFIGSVAGQIGSQTDPPYSASKAAMINFAQCLAKDLAPHGIRVNTVNPGMVRTVLNESVWKAWHDAQPENRRRSYEKWAGEKIKQIVPLGRWQLPEDVADMVVFLASQRAKEVTGQTINVDGGFVMHW